MSGIAPRWPVTVVCQPRRDLAPCCQTTSRAAVALVGWDTWWRAVRIARALADRGGHRAEVDPVGLGDRRGEHLAVSVGDDDEVTTDDGQPAVGARVRGVLDAVRGLHGQCPEGVVAADLAAPARGWRSGGRRMQRPTRGRSARASARRRPHRGAATRASPPRVRRPRGRRDVSCSCSLLDPGRGPARTAGLTGSGRLPWPRRVSGDRRPARCGGGSREPSQRQAEGVNESGTAGFRNARR